MESEFYLQRTLSNGLQSYSEVEALAASPFIVILAEPGGGKTQLMHSLARRLNAETVTANVFSRSGTGTAGGALVVDAFDELAKVDQTGIHRLFAKAKEHAPTHLIVSSRSSEWNESSTVAFEQFLGRKPTVVRLTEFTYAEQRAIFDAYVPGEDFVAFQSEVARFELAALLPNPQFLKLFADAYVESGRHFETKQSIFEKAIERLAKEANLEVAPTANDLSVSRKICVASEIFAKCLLSGSDGISFSEAGADREFPFLGSLRENVSESRAVLATRLFKPGNSESHHLPVHRIVAEYCAASYLVGRIADTSDPLSITYCLPIIAPNGVARDELRGMIGWMASLGDETSRDKLISLDPYALLANGDPSQLGPDSKVKLINRLQEVADADPYFRRGDLWRSFSMAGFFDRELAEYLRPLLLDDNGSHLRNLIVELLPGSSAIVDLLSELQQLVCSPERSLHTRSLAAACLMSSPDYKPHDDLQELFAEGSHTSFQVAADILTSSACQDEANPWLLRFFTACAKLYPKAQGYFEHTIGKRHFVRRLAASLDLITVEWLLDQVKQLFECRCDEPIRGCRSNVGPSKVMGVLLDRYCELATPPFDPERLWSWLQDMRFDSQINVNQSPAVKFLREQAMLRREIFKLAFSQARDRDALVERRNRFYHNCHSGLLFQEGDHQWISDFAYAQDNVELWAVFVVTHNIYKDHSKSGPNELRRHLRGQALQKPALMGEWAAANRRSKTLDARTHKINRQHLRMVKRREVLEEDTQLKDLKFINENRDLIASGNHWGYLRRFANLTLFEPQEISNLTGDVSLVKQSLRNCLPFISKAVPDLSRLAELRCESSSLQVERALYAACLEIFRAEQTLQNVERHFLLALRTVRDSGYEAIAADERAAFRQEVDRLLFPTEAEAEQFCRAYIEPQVADPECKFPQADWLVRVERFKPVAGKLSMEWLARYQDAGLQALRALFDIAVVHAPRVDLQTLIAARCAGYEQELEEGAPPKDNDLKTFWFIRAFYFLEDIKGQRRAWLKTDKNILFQFDTYSAEMYHSENSEWPTLSSQKVEAILDAFIEKWPKIPLPDSWGSDSPAEERAYRFLSRLIWSLTSDPDKETLAILNRMIADTRYLDFHNDLKSIRADLRRKEALRDFAPPSASEITKLLDQNAVVTVEGLRQLVLDELGKFQKDIKGGEFNSVAPFYNDSKRIDENGARDRIAERLQLRLQNQNITVTTEHQLKDAKRCDFTVAKLLNGQRRMLVTEVKGQWHKELYTAASVQLHERYSINPGAEQQGVYLVLWFGVDEKVANHKTHSIGSPEALKESVIGQMPEELIPFIDVFVLDLSR